MTFIRRDVLQSLVDDAAARIAGGFDSAALHALGACLARLALTPQVEQFVPANVGEEVLHSLYEHPRGPSLYLVSDGPGSRSPPHEHQTWALIVGLSGVERNVLYRRVPGTQKRLQRIAEHDVGPGQFLVLEEVAIHATAVTGPAPTYHLHLYGRPLHALPPFAARAYGLGR